MFMDFFGWRVEVLPPPVTEECRAGGSSDSGV